jgi:DNA-binding MarR family transcriptional regulator
VGPPAINDDAAALQVLATLLRARPRTLTELRDIRNLPVDDLEEILQRLAHAGFVRIDGDRLDVRRPEDVLEIQAAALADLTALLPSLSAEWQRGSTAASRLDVELVHGHEEQWRAWARYAAIAPPRAPLNLYPTLEVLRDVIAPDVERVLAEHRAGLRARAVVSGSAVVTGEDREVVETLVRAGMEIRLARRLDTWVYADPGVLSALPVVWGEHPPTSIMIVRDPSITALVSAYAEQVWHAAAPYAVPAPDWGDVLRMLALGMSDGAIATAQGTSVRTIQRRVAEAMAHYRVSSRFELGVAWSADHA